MPRPLGSMIGRHRQPEVVSFVEMFGREGMSLQRGMNFRRRDDHSVLLIIVRSGAPTRTV